MKVKEYAEKYQISISKVYQMIKNEELYAVKNERGHYEIDTARINFPYLRGMLEEREKIEENIKKCQSLIAK
ncbi:hypothetical protein [Enterococcus cecorum]|uniref:hypothetical protein n=1 Tax=Enterococcus cecorum TaxID=44008 RepID=UPI000B29BDF0|nr:hypothetical protein [Enterococcus cecorum]CAI3492107.1 hypothetical protein CIRMBP1308_01762 [Enterococcus cecorum]